MSFIWLGDTQWPNYNQCYKVYQKNEHQIMLEFGKMLLRNTLLFQKLEIGYATNRFQ